MLHEGRFTDRSRQTQSPYPTSHRTSLFFSFFSETKTRLQHIPRSTWFSLPPCLNFTQDAALLYISYLPVVDLLTKPNCVWSRSITQEVCKLYISTLCLYMYLYFWDPSVFRVLFSPSTRTDCTVFSLVIVSNALCFKSSLRLVLDRCSSRTDTGRTSASLFY